MSNKNILYEVYQYIGDFNSKRRWDPSGMILTM